MLSAAVTCSACSPKSEPTAATTTQTTLPPETTTTTEVAISAGKQISVWTPEVGDCWEKRKPNPFKDDEVILKLDCNLPHSNEVVGVVELKEKDFPGELIMKTLATKECPKLFNTFVGAPYELSKWELGYDYPQAAGWKATTKHVIGCYIYDKTGGKLEGSKRGSAI